MAGKLSLMLGVAAFLLAQNASLPSGANYDETKVAPYVLLDPLKTTNGGEITTVRAWEQARGRWISLFEENVFGTVPPGARSFRIHPRVTESDAPALDGLALRTQVEIPLTTTPIGPLMHLLLYLPAKHAGKVPVILGLNFAGNATVASDPGIRPTDVWTPGAKRGEPARLVPFDESKRGSQSSEWQVERVLRAGYGVATVYYGDIEPDAKTFEGTHGVRAAYPSTPGQPTWGALSAWAWGLSRATDYLLTNRHVNSKEIAITGHSRLGKATDWAAATDPRFAAVLSTESGKGGQSLYRRNFGENIAHLQHSFPYWFTAKFADWVGHDDMIPVDGNVLLALIAPRPLYVASAQDDLYSDPEGEFESARDVGSIYALFGKHGLGIDRRPPVNEPVMHDVAYHIRSGKHDVTAFDWEQYLKFMDQEFGSPLARAGSSTGGTP
ncbi:hypothetical protein SAMN05421819_3334 [Bryocella elongata]|uniref:4-O-methyl-glucuronoyl methylesterase-like domain-containing protein n=1 Tax=Bryocella elongata TaxID=863522 RepID=A0A1H6AXG6_9BACT|nr:acetylxylan esterase [Bryocella elongata]SEG53072.1 hypothetical protein SAMN05421819_3334 [Bryocella elongata]